uniref:Uncharacterized protein n=1 Tax=Arundo donax TaxID=35708 RepID=A0A0A8Z8V5_ARUDO
MFWSKLSNQLFPTHSEICILCSLCLSHN